MRNGETTYTCLKNSAADSRTLARLLRSRCKKIASLPVACCRSRIAASAFSLLRAAKYTFALCSNNAYECTVFNHVHIMDMIELTLTVSLPIPVFPPVTIVTFPERSGISFAIHFGAGGRNCAMKDRMPPEKEFPIVKLKVLVVYNPRIALRMESIYTQEGPRHRRRCTRIIV